MRRFLLTGILMFFYVHVSFAQFIIQQGTEIHVPGQIVYNDGTAVDTDIEVIEVLGGFSEENLQNKVYYFDREGKKKKLLPRDAHEINFTWREQKIRMISRKAKHHLNKQRFMHLVSDGRVRLYEYIKTYRYTGRGQMSSGIMRTSVYWYLENDDGKFITPHAIGFRRQMKKFFPDCPTLKERIKGKVYRLWEVPAIVRYYNEDCPQ